MKKNNHYNLLKYSLIILSFVLFVCAVLLLNINKPAKYVNLLPANKCVLFIGDGMGENHIKNAEAYLGKKMCFNDFEKQGYVVTDSLDLFGPTDSAAAASAMATGKKYKNSSIAYDNKNIQSISEYAKSIGLGVGIITTDDLSGATPAGFSAHAKKRGDTIDIILSQIESKVDLFLGSGYNTYYPYKEQIEEKGYKFINNLSELKMTNEKILASFENVSYHNNNDYCPTLLDLVKYAYSYFEYNFPNGYFLMIEEAHIDKRSHSNELFSMINHVNVLDEAVSFMYQALQNDNYFLMVTADHETGKLDYNVNIETYNNNMFHSKGHTSRNVPYYISSSQNITCITKIIDNTEIYQIYYELIRKR